jgi:OCT family organic cation transporter-like MFS transporter 4/5
LEGDVYINGIISSVSELFAYLLSGILAKKLGLKNTLIISYSLALAGMLALIFYQGESQFLLGLFILGSKFGVSQAFNLAYIANPYLFPISIVASSFAICNVPSRVITILAPFVVELKPVSIS